ncbi:unnamed protein product [Arctia plantaginis]|uniref:Uncharacterized protein n=1 Tax=Arctia plantaginis TaxID=874455 RepID=A0A8S1B7G8_ARCPL|nr:unnamed protein product [Arctia plantaginis]CAB3257658.1 unnamed protein product [Arctia plantaginis]
MILLLKVIEDIEQFTDNNLEEAVVDSSDSGITKENGVMHDVFQDVRATAWEIKPDPSINTEDVNDKDNEARKTYNLFNSPELQEHLMPQIKEHDESIPGERDVVRDPFQEVRATAWEDQPDSIKNEDVIDAHNEEKKAYYDLFKSRELQENILPQIEVNDKNIPGEREVSSVYLHSETTAVPRPIRKKKIRKTKKKNHKLKPKRLRQGKSKKEMKKQQQKKQHPKRKSNNLARRNNIDQPKPNVSDHNVSSENKNRGKPVDIIVHIKMNE